MMVWPIVHVSFSFVLHYSLSCAKTNASEPKAASGIPTCRFLPCIILFPVETQTKVNPKAASGMPTCRSLLRIILFPVETQTKVNPTLRVSRSRSGDRQVCCENGRLFSSVMICWFARVIGVWKRNVGGISIFGQLTGYVGGRRSVSTVTSSAAHRSFCIQAKTFSKHGVSNKRQLVS